MPAPGVISRFVAMVEQRLFLQAYEEFYSVNATEQENCNPPREGKVALIEHERRMLASAPELPVARALSVVAESDRVAIRWLIEFQRGGQRMCLDEMALQVWSGDLIVEVRYFYDPGFLART